MTPPVVVRRGDPGKRAAIKLFATTHAGLERILARELRGLGARDVTPAVRGVSFRGDLSTLYAANLWSRTASRVLVEIGTFAARDREALYAGVKAVDWEAHMRLGQTLAVDAVSSRSQLDHTQFISRVVKDAVVDSFRERRGRRPSVDPRTPDLRLNARLLDDRCTLSWDSSGQRLHRRGYRPTAGAEAPIQENLAAGILLLSGYDGKAPVFDPMCGSGTLLVEAALIARNMAPGLLGRDFAFAAHPTFDRILWQSIRENAQVSTREVDGCPVIGSDVSGEAVRAAQTAVRGAGVDDVVAIKRARMEEMAERGEGMLVTNPPYGERLGELGRLGDLYSALGDTLKHRCRGMTAHVLTGSKFLAGKIGLKTARRDVLWNGAIECRLLHFELY